MKKTFTLFLVPLAVILASGRSGAGGRLTGNEVLKKIDGQQLTKDKVSVAVMKLVDSNGTTTERTLKMYTKGSNYHLIKFLAPADIAGTGFLSRSSDNMWLYLPALGRVRRITGHISHGSFMGSDFNYKDLSSEGIEKDFTAKVESFKDGEYQLTLSPKSSDSPYSMVKIWVKDDTFVPLRMEFYDPAGKLLKILINTEVKKIGNKWFPMSMTMTNVQDNHKTEITVEELKIDTGLKDSLFTDRSLKEE
ncbi:MAG: outer membrane lipoprotein-sorting protein [Deltaproteobacteria bacterium]|nr:outer membrane lipoprotein-sorting protein [Deltaproteobacteria bacterium]MCL5277553.1 outer membrane lipoprotein-sorting protein [Deltaproteobacteria bacterium]